MTGPRAQPETRVRPTAAAPSPAAARARMTTSASARATLSGLLVRVSHSQATAPRASASASTPTTRAARRSGAGASGRTRAGRGADGSAGAPNSRSARRRGSDPRAPLGSVTTARLRGPGPSSSRGNPSGLVNLAVMRALVVVNPAATTTTPGMRDVLVGALGGALKLDVVETGHRGHARELGAEAAADGMDLVVSVGGDGTVNEVVNGLLENGPAPSLPMLAVIPGGSTNVFSRALGRSRDPVEATAQILASLRAGTTRMISLGTVSATGTSTAPVSGTDPEKAEAAAEADAAVHDSWTDPRWFVFAAG